jgi:hypothetical protein
MKKKYLDWYTITYRVDTWSPPGSSQVHTMARSKVEARKKFPQLRGRILEVIMAISNNY